MRKLGLLGAVLAALVLAAGCGSAGGGSAGPGAGRSQTRPVRAAQCSKAPPSVVTATKAVAGSGLVRPGPVVASVCQYGIDIPAVKLRGMLRQIVLRGQAASGLAAFIDSAEPRAASRLRCYRQTNLLPFVQRVVFGYPEDPPTTVVVTYTDCSYAVVSAGGHSGVLAMANESDLFYWASASAQRQGSRIPELVGLTVRAAMATARRSHLTLSFDGAVVDSAAPFGTVVFQSLPAGSFDSGPGGQVGVLTAVHPAPDCSTGQLALSYIGGGPGAGNDFGTLVVRDRSQRACTLTGPLRVTGLAADGRAVTTTIADPVTSPAVLSPDAAPVTRQHNDSGNLTGVQPGELAGVITLSADYRDGPVSVDNGMCNPLWRVPAMWRVVFPDGQALSVANADPANPIKLVPSGGFVTCRGQLGVAQPADVGAP